ncbi:MAG TPA: hypothetical protein VJ747_14900 [Stellaceae bacterium]|nr:hypothetical protein [Stellaceae bacterium]
MGTMSDQRLPLAFAASINSRPCEERDSATRQSPSSTGVLPEGDCFASLAMRTNGWDARRTALILTGALPPLPSGEKGEELRFAIVRHAGGAAAAQAGACSCCRVPSDLVTVLRRLVIERARGEIDIEAVLVAGRSSDLARLERDALADPFIAARYVLRAAR